MTDADRAMVEREIARCRKLARDAKDHAESLYANGVADLLELIDTADAVQYIREKALRSLAGDRGIHIPGDMVIRPEERWLATWWLTYRTRKAREALNRDRAAHGLPPVIRNLMARADDWD